jgi:hypothetical protein
VRDLVWADLPVGDEVEVVARLLVLHRLPRDVQRRRHVDRVSRKRLSRHRVLCLRHFFHVQVDQLPVLVAQLLPLEGLLVVLEPSAPVQDVHHLPPPGLPHRPLPLLRVEHALGQVTPGLEEEPHLVVRGVGHRFARLLPGRHVRHHLEVQVLGPPEVLTRPEPVLAEPRQSQPLRAGQEERLQGNRHLFPEHPHGLRNRRDHRLPDRLYLHRHVGVGPLELPPLQVGEVRDDVVCVHRGLAHRGVDGHEQRQLVRVLQDLDAGVSRRQRVHRRPHVQEGDLDRVRIRIPRRRGRISW